MGAVDGRFGAGGEAGFHEGLHVGGVGEGEGWVGEQGHEDVVGVHGGVAGLGEAGECVGAGGVGVAVVAWRGGVGGCGGGGGHCGCDWGVGLAYGGLSVAGVSSLYFTVGASR